MENVLLVIHLILALALIGVVLLQRSEGGGLGMGSGGGDGVMSARSAATALSKLTWVFAGAFLVTSVALTVISASGSRDSSVLDMMPPTQGTVDDGAATPAAPAVPDISGMMPPSASDEPAAVPRAE